VLGVAFSNNGQMTLNFDSFHITGYAEPATVEEVSGSCRWGSDYVPEPRPSEGLLFIREIIYEHG
jgi:hypothetical protein